MDQLQGNMMNTMMNTNLIGMMSMKENVSVYQILFGILMMNLMAFVPTIKHSISLYLQKYIRKGKQKIDSVVTEKPKGSKDKEILSSIKFVKSKNTDIDIVFNSINYYITNNDNSKFLHYNHDFSVINDNLFQLNETIYCKVQNDLPSGSGVLSTEDKENSNYSIEIFSYDVKLTELKKFIDEIKQKYLYEQKNKLGHQKFYFDEKQISLPKDQDGIIRFDTAPKSLTFTMTPFHTNKSLSNVFGKHLRGIKERVNMFLNNREWYSTKGVPYTLGIMLHGPPGTGKTSLIKAIAKDSNRHVFNIKFRKDSTQTQLRNLFFNEKVDVVQNGRTESFNIPIEERVYVIEDIDCLTDVLNERGTNITTNNNTNIEINNKDNPSKLSYKEFQSNDMSVYSSYSNINEPTTISSMMNYTISDTENNKEIKPFKQDNNPYSNGEEINLSFILNLMDGILETPGRVLIVTSNHPDKLDKAFIRPGRIDINLEVGYCTKEMIQEMFEFFYEEKCDDLFINFEYKNKLTPAEVNKIILNNFNDIDNAYNTLVAS